jgi:hypothetical protein
VQPREDVDLGYSDAKVRRGRIVNDITSNMRRVCTASVCCVSSVE